MAVVCRFGIPPGSRPLWDADPSRAASPLRCRAQWSFQVAPSSSKMPQDTRPTRTRTCVPSKAGIPALLARAPIKRVRACVRACVCACVRAQPSEHKPIADKHM